MTVTVVVMLLAGVVLMVPARAADTSSCAEGVCVKVLGRSGKITMAKVDTAPEIASDPDRVTITMDSLKEVDAQGNAVGTTGATKHSFNTFAAQDFTFSPVQSGSLQGVSASYFTFTSTLSGLSSQVKVTMYIFKADGNITFDGETQLVKEGNVKFNIELSSWAFCSPATCKKGATDETGEFVDVTLEIKGKGSASSATTDDGTDGFNLGGDAMMTLSNKVRIDNQWQDMEDNYPMYAVQGGKQKFTFRFNKFTQNAFYDPTLDLDSDSGAETTVLSLSALLVCAGVLLAQLL